MVKSQALRLLPDWNCSRLVHALSTVSCTRSSARAGSPHSERPKARNAGNSAVTCSRKWSCPVMSRPGVAEDRAPAPSGAALLVFELLQQRLELVRHGLVHDVAEHAAQPALQPVRHLFGAARSRCFRRLAWFDFFAHDHGWTRTGALAAGAAWNSHVEPERPTIEKVPSRRNLSPLSHILQPPLSARATLRP